MHAHTSSTFASRAFSMAGKRVLVTGAGRGIGLAAAHVLAEAGAHVTLAARSADEVEAGAADIRSKGGDAQALPMDVMDIEHVRRTVEETAEPFHVLVNNAGTNRPKPFTDVTVEDFDAVVDLNLRSAFFVAQAVARRLIRAGSPGAIINVSSQLGHVGAPNRSIYCATKHGMEGLTKAMALDLAPHGIRVNTLCPTFIETPLTRPFLADEAFKASVLAKIKLGRIGQVDDLMGAILFLASDASSLMTGTHLLIDGGWTAD